MFKLAQIDINSLQASSSDMNKLFDQLQRNHPRVIVFEYAWFWPPGSPYSCPLVLKLPSTQQKQTMNDLVTQMNSVLAYASAAHGFTFVNVNAGFDGHRLCDAGTPWFQSNPLNLVEDAQLADGGGLTQEIFDAAHPDLDLFHRGVFHPTAEGQMVYTGALEHVLGCV